MSSRPRYESLATMIGQWRPQVPVGKVGYGENPRQKLQPAGKIL